MANNPYVNKVVFGSATLVDLTGTTATADKILEGYGAYGADGAWMDGTATGGGGDGYVWQDSQGYVHLSDEQGSSVSVEPISITQNGTYTAPTGKAYSPVTVNVSGGTPPTPTPAPWVRPSDWPDLDKMDVSGGDIIYMTSYADEARGFCDFYINCTDSYTVELGGISGTTFITESTHTYASRDHCQLYYGSVNGTYKVLKVSGTNIKNFYIDGSSATITLDGFKGYKPNQGIIDIVGKLPSCTYVSFTSIYNLVNANIGGLILNQSMANMFQNCYSLTHLDVSEWDTSLVTNMNSMFYNCYSLMHLDVGEWDISSVTIMSSVFYNCYSLTHLDVGEWDTSKVTNMSSMFYNCTSLTSLDVSEWDTSKVTNMSYMFHNCPSLTSLDVSGWNTSKVTNMSYIFYSCYSLTHLDVSGWDTSLVTNMSYMFQNCYSLTYLDVSGWDFTKVTNTGSMFRYCAGLHGSITIPATITTIAAYCFSVTRDLYEYHFLSTTPPALSNTNAFDNMDDFGGKIIYVPSASLTAYQTATNWSTYASYMVGE